PDLFVRPPHHVSELRLMEKRPRRDRSDLFAAGVLLSARHGVLSSEVFRLRGLTEHLMKEPKLSHHKGLGVYSRLFAPSEGTSPYGSTARIEARREVHPCAVVVLVEEPSVEAIERVLVDFDLTVR